MATAVCKLKSTAPYSQSKHISDEKEPGENAVDYERRLWRKRLHVGSDGNVFIPPTAFTNSLAEAAKYLDIRVPGKGKANYTKNFEAGVRVIAPLVLAIKAEDVQPEELFVPSDGKRGGGTRVTKFFPYIPEWSGTVTYHVIDPVVTEEAFMKALGASGTLIGIGRFRPKNMGYYGTFEAINVKWSK